MSPRRIITIVALAAALGGQLAAGATPVFADHDHHEWRHDRGRNRGWHRERYRPRGYYYRGYYTEPYVYYAPPPVYVPPPPPPSVGFNLIFPFTIR